MSDLDLAALDLTVDDRDPQAIFDAAAAVLANGVFGLQLRNGSIEAVLLEAQATAAADVIYASNRMISGIVEAQLKLYALTRDPGQPATGTVRLTLDASRDLTVDAGTSLSLPDSSVTLTVTETTSGTAIDVLDVPVATEDATASVNGLAAGAVVDLLDSIPYVASAVTLTAMTGGTAAEPDAAYLARARTRLARVTDSLVLPVHFTAYCAEDVRVSRALTIDLWAGGFGILPGENPGHVTVALYGHGGPLSGDVLAELETEMQARTSAILNVHVISAAIQMVDVDVTVAAASGADGTALAAAVESAIRAYLDPENTGRDWNEPARVLSLAAVIADVPGVDYIAALDAPADDVDPDSNATLMAAGDVTVTVT